MLSNVFDKVGQTYKLKESSTIISELSFTEEFNADKLATLLMNMAPLNSYRRDNARNQVDLMKYLEDHFDLRGEDAWPKNRKISYKQNNDLKTRQQSVGSSAQGMLREARHFIYYDNYLDIDMKNCHPEIILYLCQELGIECSCLEKYVKNREAVIVRCIEHCGKFMETDEEMLTLTRDFFKMYFLQITYGCGPEKIKKLENRPEYIDNFASEVANISKSIMGFFPEYFETVKEARIKNNKDYNHFGAALSNLCQTFEAYLLEEMFKILKTKSPKFSDKSILCFDGIMIHKKCFDDSYTVHHYISDCHSQIDLPCFKLDIKSMEDTHNKIASLYKYKKPEKDNDYVNELFQRKITKFINELKNMPDEGFKHEPQTYISDFIDLVDTYKIWPSEHMLCEFLSAHINKYAVRILNSQPGVFLQNISHDIICQKQFADHNLFYWKKKKEAYEVKSCSLQKYILKSSVVNRIKKYDAVQSHPFTKDAPSKCNARIFNSYQGFKAKLLDVSNEELLKSKKLQTWINHLKTVLCEDALHFEYLLSWLNQMFKKTNLLTKRTLVFHSSGQQAGKGIFWDWIRESIVGSRYAEKRQGLSWLSSDFNAEIENTVLNVMEEASNLTGENYHEAFDRFKSYSVDNMITIHEKHQTPRQAYNYNNFVILTNNEHPIKIEEKDARFAVFQASDCMIGNKDYFTYLADECRDEQTSNEFYTYIYNYEARVSVLDQPKSDLYKQMQSLSLCSSKRFMKEIVQMEVCSEDPTYTSIYSNCEQLDNTSLRIRKTHLYASYVNWAKAAGEKPQQSKYFYGAISEVKNVEIKRLNGYEYVYIYEVRLFIDNTE